jgi:adenylate kinase
MQIKKPQAFIFIGRSGSGKGTQANFLINKLKEIDPKRETLYIQTGQEFRKFIQGKSYTEKLSAEYYRTGKLQPNFLAVKMWVDFLVDKLHGNEHVIFDGSPREFHEAGVLDSVFPFYGFEKPNVIDLYISDEEALKRLLLRKRVDDTEDGIKKRLAWYAKEVEPTIKYFHDNPKYHFMKINGEQTPEAIFKDLSKELGLN